MNLPANGEPDPKDDAVADQIDAICDSFEVEVLGGLAPRIEDYIVRIDTHHRPGLFCELVAIEIEYRRQLHLACDRAVYMARFPEYRELLDSIDFGGN